METTDGVPPAPKAPAIQALRILCPHCHNPIQLLDDRSDEVLCPGCGSSFRLREAPQTTTVDRMKRPGLKPLLKAVVVAWPHGH